MMENHTKYATPEICNSCLKGPRSSKWGDQLLFQPSIPSIHKFYFNSDPSPTPRTFPCFNNPIFQAILRTLPAYSVIYPNRQSSLPSSRVRFQSFVRDNAKPSVFGKVLPNFEREHRPIQILNFKNRFYL